MESPGILVIMNSGDYIAKQEVIGLFKSSINLLKTLSHIYSTEHLVSLIDLLETFNKEIDKLPTINLTKLAQENKRMKQVLYPWK